MTRPWMISAVLMSGLYGIPALAQEASHPPMEGPVAVASAYLDAMESSDLDRAENLFSVTSSVFESGGVEGSWQDYRQHHIGPELDQIVTFVLTRSDPESQTSEDGTMSFVAWPIAYKIELADGRLVNSRGTVSFVLVREAEHYRIRHLHWSSRPERQSGSDDDNQGR